jgi:hypothetical protein
LCQKHYTRERRHGTCAPPPRAHGTLGERFARYFTKGAPGECWLWRGPRNGHGYGNIGRGGRGNGLASAHRLSYELHVGPIPEGRDIDHLCRTPLCVNPAHLEPVSRGLNTHRGIRFHPVPRPWLQDTGEAIPPTV